MTTLNISVDLKKLMSIMDKVVKQPDKVPPLILDPKNAINYDEDFNCAICLSVSINP
jgi:hypothetical protein